MSIAKLTVGDTIIDQKFFLLGVESKTAKNGTKFVLFTIGDGVRQLQAYYWNEIDLEASKGASVISITGEVSEWNNKLKIDATSFSFEKEGLEELIPQLSKDKIQELKAKVEWLKSKLDEEDKKFFEALFEIIEEDFYRAPGASLNHHAYLGGLAEHSITVARMAASISSCYEYEAIDTSLLILAALIHDIGKIWENDYSSYPFKKTLKGVLVEHLTTGVQFVGHLSAKLNYSKRLQLEHIIISHHDLLEWGVPVVPMTPEAIIVAKSDYIDYFIQKHKEVDISELDELGFKYDRTLNRKLFKPNTF